MKWIKISDGLPENTNMFSYTRISDVVLVWIGENDYSDKQWTTAFYDYKNKEWVLLEDNHYTAYEIIAWAAPDPYEP
jgi:hypothetical protein